MNPILLKIFDVLMRIQNKELYIAYDKQCGMKYRFSSFLETLSAFTPIHSTWGQFKFSFFMLMLSQMVATKINESHFIENF